MNLVTEPYLQQRDRWPDEGRHVLAQFDDESIVVYQAFTPYTAESALREQRMAEGFRLQRMSWIKPGFLWMMFRSGWGTKPRQEVPLAIRIHRSAFDAYLAHSVAATCPTTDEAGTKTWREALSSSDVRLQWDPDHDPSGGKVTRRAIQIGLRGAALRDYAHEAILEIEDLRPFIRKQVRNVGDLERLVTPREEVYPIADARTARRIDLSPAPRES